MSGKILERKNIFSCAHGMGDTPCPLPHRDEIAPPGTDVVGDKPSDSQVGGDHYKSMPIQPHYFCHVNKLGALESNVVKYVCRHSRKNGKADLHKARHYIDLLLEWEYGET